MRRLPMSPSCRSANRTLSAWPPSSQVTTAERLAPHTGLRLGVARGLTGWVGWAVDVSVLFVQHPFHTHTHTHTHHHQRSTFHSRDPLTPLR